jgi:hypothetical protein
MNGEQITISKEMTMAYFSMLSWHFSAKRNGTYETPVKITRNPGKIRTKYLRIHALRVTSTLSCSIKFPGKNFHYV